MHIRDIFIEVAKNIVAHLTMCDNVVLTDMPAKRGVMYFVHDKSANTVEETDYFETRDNCDSYLFAEPRFNDFVNCFYETSKTHKMFLFRKNSWKYYISFENITFDNKDEWIGLFQQFMHKKSLFKEYKLEKALFWAFHGKSAKYNHVLMDPQIPWHLITREFIFAYASSKRDVDWVNINVEWYFSYINHKINEAFKLGNYNVHLIGTF